MRLTPRRIKALTLDLPRIGKLAWCLYRDPRVPRRSKAALSGALALVLSPFDLPGWLPVVGQFDELALVIMALRLFVDSCPDEVVAEHSRAIRQASSTFDQDLRRTVGGARQTVGRLVGQLQGASRP